MREITQLRYFENRIDLSIAMFLFLVNLCLSRTRFDTKACLFHLRVLRSHAGSSKTRLIAIHDYIRFILYLAVKLMYIKNG